MDLVGGFVDQEQAAQDQDQVAPGDGVVEEGEGGLGQARDPGDAGQKQEPRSERHPDAQPAGEGLLLARQLVEQALLPVAALFLLPAAVQGLYL